MQPEKISSRKNPYIVHLRALAADGDYRREKREYLCDGMKLLREALLNGAEILSALWRQGGQTLPLPSGTREFTADGELFDYASPMKNSPGPVFTLRMPEQPPEVGLSNAVILENVQDPGNVGTVLRSAAALGIDAVLLCGACADLYSPKTARAAMGALFRQRVIQTDVDGAAELAGRNSLPLLGAALSDGAMDIRQADVKRAAVAIGSEGRGLSPELLARCDGQIIIPMTPGSESLNAAAAAAVIMWEMAR